jgi:hypothetical protein
MGGIEQALARVYDTVLRPVFAVSKKRRRLDQFGIRDLADLDRVTLDPQGGTQDCLPLCADIVRDHRRYAGRFAFGGAPGTAGPARPRRILPAIIDLDRYGGFPEYVRALKPLSKGATLRQIRKARDRGFVSRQIHRRRYRRELFEIETSTRFRSAGLVLAAYLRRPPADAGGGAADRQPPRPHCLLHWSIYWGVFAPDEGGERLVGFIFVKRVGNSARIAALMGHNRHLSAHVMKLLFADVMQWLLDREDPSVRGLRYLHYGALEDGNDGLAFWKSRFRFEPAVFAWAERQPPLPAAEVSAVQTAGAPGAGRHLGPVRSPAKP